MRFAASIVLLGVLAGVPANAGKLYWSQGLSGSRIQRADLDGTNVETVIELELGVSALTLDPVARKIYWAEGAGPIRRANLDGSGVEIVVEAGFGIAQALALDREGGKIYVGTVFFEGCVAVQRYDLDGSGVEDIVPDVCPLAVAVDPSRDTVFWGEASPEIAVRRADLNGSNVETVASTSQIPFGVAAHSGLAKVYWTQPVPPQTVQRADYDGTNYELLISSDAAAHSIALDTLAGKMYWQEDSPEVRIVRADLDGTNPETILTSEFVGAFVHLAIDPVPDGPDVPAVSAPVAVAVVLFLGMIAARIRRQRDREQTADARYGR